jgi:YD repeat-containing protein
LAPQWGLCIFSYDRSQRLTGFQQPDGTRATAVYDSTSGIRLATINSQNARSSYQYDAQQELMRVTQPNNVLTTFAGNGTGALIQRTLPSGAQVVQGYSNGQISKVTDPAGKSATFVRDSTSRPVGYVDRLGNRTTAAYDPGLGSLQRVTNPLGARVSMVRDPVTALVTQVQGMPTV